MELQSIADACLRVFEEKTAAREKALPASRQAVRSSANAIRAIHRGDFERAHGLMEDARAAIQLAADAVAASHADVYFAGFVQDAQKEYAEARLTEALVTGVPLPGPDEIGVEVAPYLNGMAEAIGEGRREILDLLRRGELAESERILTTIDDMYHVLVSMDFPDSITRNLRHSTDAARAIMERTRGDLSIALVQRQLQEALERHAEQFGGEPPAR